MKFYRCFLTNTTVTIVIKSISRVDIYTLVQNPWDEDYYDPPRHHPMFRGSSSRWVNLCSSSSSWTHAWTLNSCTIVSPRYEKGGGRGRGERRVSSHCSSGPGHGEPRSVINDTRNGGRTCAALPFPSLPPSIRARSAEEEAVLSTGSIFRTRTRVASSSR